VSGAFLSTQAKKSRLTELKLMLTQEHVLAALADQPHAQCSLCDGFAVAGRLQSRGFPNGAGRGQPRFF
jgi:hypothetical protein